jgi:molybdenum cofactor guanylyltransferase
MNQEAPSSMGAWEICILAGGRSSRMGRDKSRVTMGGKSFLEHIRQTARSLGWPVRVIRRDLVERCGPVGGIYTALKTSRAPAVLVLSCDMPFVSADFMRTVIERIGLEADADAAFTEAGGQCGFPLALKSEVLARMEPLLTHPNPSLQQLARRLRAIRIHVGDDRQMEILNVNTPSDLALARAFWRKSRRMDAGQLPVKSKRPVPRRT